MQYCKLRKGIVNDIFHCTAGEHFLAKNVIYKLRFLKMYTVGYLAGEVIVVFNISTEYKVHWLKIIELAMSADTYNTVN